MYGSGAVRRLQEPECHKVLDGSSRHRCRCWSAVEMLTSPGIPRIYVCGRFAMTQVRERWLAEALVIQRCSTPWASARTRLRASRSRSG